MFGSGPRLTRDAKKFLLRLEDSAEIELLGAFCQAESQSFGAIFRDLADRRGILAVPLMAAFLWSVIAPHIFRPVQERSFKRKFDGLRGKIHFVKDIHAQAVLDTVCGLAPDLGLIYGSPILKPVLFEIPRLGTLGIHHGKVPEYRGNKTAFWAMYNGEAYAGVTIQKINAGLDTGEIVHEGQVETGRRSLRKVWNRLEDVGLDLYLQSILEVKQGTAVHRPQQGRRGPLYRNPKPKHYLEFWLRRLKRLFGAQ